MIKKLILLTPLLLLLSCSRSNDDTIISGDAGNPKDNNIVLFREANEILSSQKFKQTFDKSANKQIVKPLKKIETVSYNEEPIYYIANYEGGGFAIISADKRIDPVQAYSESGSFEYNKVKDNNGIGFWLKTLKSDINEVRKNDIKQSQNIKKGWDILLGMAPPDTGPKETLSYTGNLISTTWGQGVGYNNFTPILNCGTHTPTGCVATAMAQIMKFYNYSSINNYNWSDMPISTGSNGTSRLMSDIGIAVNMQYSCNSSGAYNSSIIPGFSHFGYSYVKSKNISGQFRDSTLDNQLALGNPVLMTGNNGIEGHAWVCDQQYYYSYWDGTSGYSIFMYHMNWGWDSQQDGFFKLNNLNPYNYNFNNNVTIYYDFKH